MARHQQKRPELLAVVVADNYDVRFAPFNAFTDWANKKIGGPFTALQNCMLWLTRTSVTKVIVVVLKNKGKDDKIDTAKEDKLKEEVMNYRGYYECSVVAGENLMSVGDAIREVEQRGLITADFLLIHNVATFCSSTLEEEVANFRERRKQNKDNCMTLIYTRSVSEKNPMIGFGKNSKKLMYYFKKDRMPVFDARLDFYLSDTEIRRDLRDTGIAICGANIATQFTDNFDFLERDDVIRELLVNEELLGQHIHVEVLADSYEAAVVQDYHSLLEVQSLVLERWFHPSVPETRTLIDIGKRPTTYAEVRNLYISAKRKDYLFQRYGKVKACRRDVFFDSNVKTGDDCSFENVTLGCNTEIGNNCSLKNCRIGNNVVIHNNVKLVDCVVDDNVLIGNDCEFSSRTFIGGNLIIPDDTKMLDEARDGRILVSDPPSDEQDFAVTESDGFYTLRYKHRTGFWKNSNLERHRARTVSNMDHVSHSGRQSDTEPAAPVHHSEDDRFLIEVFESMQQAYANIGSDEHNSSNLILEINSSKLAYNISMEKVAAGVMKSFIRLVLLRDLTPTAAKELIEKWVHVFRNYYGPSSNQINLLLALEECCTHDPTVLKFVDHIVHCLYVDCDVLTEEAILNFFDNLAENSPVRTKLQRIHDWLMESDESSDESESESED